MYLVKMGGNHKIQIEVDTSSSESLTIFFSRLISSFVRPLCLSYKIDNKYFCQKIESFNNLELINLTIYHNNELILHIYSSPKLLTYLVKSAFNVKLRMLGFSAIK